MLFGQGATKKRTPTSRLPRLVHCSAPHGWIYDGECSTNHQGISKPAQGPGQKTRMKHVRNERSQERFHQGCDCNNDIIEIFHGYVENARKRVDETCWLVIQFTYCTGR
jgi:hypothetical protein